MDPNQKKSSWHFWNWLFPKSHKSIKSTTSQPTVTVATDHSDPEDEPKVQSSFGSLRRDYSTTFQRSVSAPESLFKSININTAPNTNDAGSQGTTLHPAEIPLESQLKTEWKWKSKPTINKPDKTDGKVKTDGKRALPRAKKAASERLLRPRKFDEMLAKMPVEDDAIAGFEMGDVSNNWASVSRTEMAQGESQLVDPGYFKVDGFEDLLQDADGNPLEQIFTPYAFIMACIFLIVWGVIGIIQTLILLYVQSECTEFLNLDKNFKTDSSTYVFAATGLSIACGIFGIVALLYDFRWILDSIPIFLLLTSVFSMAAGITAFGSVSTPTKSTYARIMEASALYNQNPEYLEAIRTSWPDLKPNVWDRIQKTFQCCGLSDPSDWLRAPANVTIPASCCSGTEDHCVAQLEKWAVGKSTYEQRMASFNEIKKLLHLDSCFDAIHLERKHRIRDWGVYPVIYFGFHLIIMIQMNYLCYLLLIEYETWDGLSRLAIFRSTNMEIFKARLAHTFCSLFKCCKKCREKKAEAENTDNRRRHIYDTENMRSFATMSSTTYLGNIYNAKRGDEMGEGEENELLSDGYGNMRSRPRYPHSSSFSEKSVRSSI